MARYRYRVVDVFTQTALEGNPLAVFPNASGMDEATMQKIAREMNLSETVFALPATRADCVARVRIFTPTREMQFAGHPTVGGVFVLLDEDIVPKGSDHFLLEEKIGPVAIRVDRGASPLIWLRTPEIRFLDKYDPAACARALGLDRADLMDIAPQVVSAGNPAIFVPLKDKGAVDRAFLDLAPLQAIKSDRKEVLAAFVFTPTPDGAYSRMFAPEHGVIEDPATGSMTGPLAAFMLRNGLTPAGKRLRFISEQGTKIGRRSILHVLIHGEQGEDGIDVGGHVMPLVDATMTIP